jgi:hypothetical protein
LVSRLINDNKTYTLVIIFITILVAALVAGCTGTTKTSDTNAINPNTGNGATLDLQAGTGNNSSIYDNDNCNVNNTSSEAPVAPSTNGKNNRVMLSMNDALTIASDYAKSHYEGFNTTIVMTLDRSELLDHGSDGLEYYFTWTEIVAGVYTRNNVVVGVNAENGAIIRYYENHEPLRIDPKASISKDQAMIIAANSDYFKNYTPDTIDAKLCLGSVGAQRLVWLVDIMCYINITAEGGTIIQDHRGGWVTVDANTGDIVEVNPCR